MKYEEALELCLADVRAGRDLEAALARYPEHAGALRRDLAVGRAVADLPASFAPSLEGAQRARTEMLGEIRSARARRETHSLLRLVVGRPLALSGLAAAIALVAVALALAWPRLLGPASTAEAAFDGVVLDNQSGTLTVQTSSGIETVTSPTTQPVDPATIAGLQPGAFVSIQGKRLKDGSVLAAGIRPATMEAISDWCDIHGDQCLQLKTGLERQVQACQHSPQACAALAARLQQLEQKLSGHAGQLSDLDGHCQEGAAGACSQLKAFCSSHSSLCTRVRVSPPGIASALATRVQNLKDQCTKDARACQELKTFCGQRPDVCGAVHREIQTLQDSLQDRRGPPN